MTKCFAVLHQLPTSFKGFIKHANNNGHAKKIVKYEIEDLCALRQNNKNNLHTSYIVFEVYFLQERKYLISRLE